MKKAKLHLSEDRRLGDVVAATKLTRHVTDGDVYFALLRAVVFQQLSGKAAGTIHSRFLNLFEGNYPDPAVLISMDEALLTGVGLSRQKSKYIRNVATLWMAKRCDEIDWKLLGDDAVVEHLTTIKGVGTWTAQMILMFTLERPDVFPVNDLGIRNAMIKLYRLRSKGRVLDRRMLEIAEAWRPHRTLACRYLWRSIDG